MRSVTVVRMLAIAAQAVLADRADDAQSFLSTGKLAHSLVDSLLGRALRASTGHPAGVDTATLGKAEDLAISRRPHSRTRELAEATIIGLADLERCCEELIAQHPSSVPLASPARRLSSSKQAAQARPAGPVSGARPKQTLEKEPQGESAAAQRIKDIEKEIAKTQVNKATMSHLCRLRAQLAKLRTEVQAQGTKSGGTGEGFDVEKVGDGRVALIGFPSVGKSTVLSHFTDTQSECAAYEFTTLTCIPGIIHHKGCRIQLLDLPGIIEGASEGRGKGRQVIAVAKSCDLVLITLDIGSGKADRQKELLEKELNAVGIRLNKKPPNIWFKRKGNGPIHISSTCALTKITETDVRAILHEYKINSAEVVFREDISAEEFIDAVEGNRKYCRCLYVYNKCDLSTIEEIDRVTRLPDSMVLSCNLELNTDIFVDKIWEYLAMVRVYTKPRNAKPDFADPVVLTESRSGMTVEAAVKGVHKDLLDKFDYALVWGTSVKFYPQRVGLAHKLEDEDVMQIVPKNTVDPKFDPHNMLASWKDPTKSKQQHRKAKASLKS